MDRKENNYNSNFIQGLLDNPRTQGQMLIVEKWPRMVNRILSEVEKSLQDGNQCRQLKRSLNSVIYSARNDLLIYFNSDECRDKDEDINRVRSEFENMMANINKHLEAALVPNSRHFHIVSGFIEEIVLDVVSDVVKDF